MTLDELKKLIADDEGETVEVKETTGQRRDACETLCAFLNKDGGTVVFGVTKKGKLTGQLMADTTKRDLFEVFQKFEPAADIEVSYVPVDETHTAIVCHVDGGNRKPYIYDGKPYKRVQSSTTVMSQEEYERMLLARGGFRSEWEDQPNPGLSLDDLDLDVIRDTARKAVRVGRLDESVDTENAAALLDHFKLRKNGTLLNGAAVLFGKADRIDYPQLEIKMGWFKGTDQRVFLDNSHVQGNVFKLMDAAMAFCFKHLNLAAWTSGKIERDEELEIPADALREALVNAFAHRSYENRSQTIYLAIYDDRVEIKNPGKFPSDFNLARLYSPPIQHSEPRNEKIARVLYLRKSIETWGRGLTRIANECARVGLPVPEVKEEYGCVTTVFRRPDWTGANTPDQRTGTGTARTGTTSARTGTGRGLSGTGWTIIGTTAQGVMMTPPAVTTTPQGENAPAQGENAPAQGENAPVQSIGKLIPLALEEKISGLGRHVKAEILRDIIVELCKVRPMGKDDLMQMLGRKERTIKKLVTPLLGKELDYLYPMMVHHPRQAYVAKRKGNE